MNFDEALKIGEPPHEIGASIAAERGKAKKSTAVYIICICLLLSIILFSCFNIYKLYNSYLEVKQQYSAVQKKVEELTNVNSSLTADIDQLKKQNDEIKLENYKISEESKAVLEFAREIQKQNNDLIKENKELTDDNIALQNSLKMAASVGIKPQNYSRFEGITSRGTLERGEYLGKFFGTAYTPSKVECGNDNGITNSGQPIIPGISLAVDGKYWPFGTIFYIRGLGYAVAMDTGSAIKGKNRFDFAVFDRKFALTLGAKNWDVYLVKLGDGKIGKIEF